ncbi:ABC transporter substrate-binding protein [Halococcus sp. IIIV-5B]|uniref:ABC transporter substrate-binding protein n=1 Tax=Halococcus sp. IIIV-5B TaxID=2321230 RepID=UPI000E76437E|nr:extracellular solute-binding protein [Halococcus sp. IIIV-5B]RJT01489.1 extracellular solute-binding protein [Halococcus sp. IIIV-5B]
MANRNRGERTRRDVVKGIAGSAATIGITSTAGCLGGGGGGDGGNGSGGNGSGGNGSDGGNSGGGGGQTELLFWTESFNNSAAKKWENWYRNTLKQQNSVSLSVSASTYADRRENFLTGARQGQPDYLEGILNHLTEFQAAELIEPLTDYAEQLDYWDGFTDGAIRAVTYKGDVWGMPWTGNGRALLYRNDIFDDLGLEPPETAQQFLKVGRTIKEQRDDITPFHNCTKDGSSRGFQEFMSHVYQHEDQLYSVNNGSWEVVPDADALVSVFTNWYHNVWASDNPIANTDQLGTGWQVLDYGYLNGDYAMVECGPWILDSVSEDAVEDQKAAEQIMFENTTVKALPHDSNASRGTFLEVKPVMVNSFSSNKQKAKEAAGLYCSPQAFRKMKNTGMNLATPLHTDISSTIETKSLQPFKQVAKTGRPLAKVPWGETREAIYPKIQGVAYGEMDPQQAGQTLHEELTQIAGEFEG